MVVRGPSDVVDRWPMPTDPSQAVPGEDHPANAAIELPTRSTRRTCSEGAEALLGELMPVLDQGFVQVIDYMGDDFDIVQAARVSYGPSTKRVHNDRGLLRYLMRHRHTTPFEMCEVKFRCKMPIFVARQWIRHRTANVNEMSLRYSRAEDTFYVPAIEQITLQSRSNRQGRDGETAVPLRRAKTGPPALVWAGGLLVVIGGLVVLGRKRRS